MQISLSHSGSGSALRRHREWRGHSHRFTLAASDLQTQRQPVYRQVFGRIFNLILRVTLGLNFKDTQCGFKAFNRRSAQKIFPLQKIERWGFDPELLFLAGAFLGGGGPPGGGAPRRGHPQPPGGRARSFFRNVEDSLELLRGK